jgi:hypothetical protein
MSAKENNGCVQTGCSIWILLSFVSVVIFFSSNNSVDEVEELTIENILHLTILESSKGDTKSANELNGKIMDKLKKEGIDPKEKLKKALQKNKYINSVKIKKVESEQDVDKIRISLILEKDGIKIPARIFFLVQQKSLLNYSLAKLIPIYSVILDPGNRSVEYKDQEAFVAIASLYDEKAIAEIIDGTIEAYNTQNKLPLQPTK